MRTAHPLPSRGAWSHRGDEQINTSTGNHEACAAAELDTWCPQALNRYLAGGITGAGSRICGALKSGRLDSIHPAGLDRSFHVSDPRLQHLYNGCITTPLGLIRVKHTGKVKVSHVRLCHPMDYTVDGILQARTLEWVAVPFSWDFPNPGIEPRSPALQAESLPAEPQGKRNIHVSQYKWLGKESGVEYMFNQSSYGFLIIIPLTLGWTLRGSFLGPDLPRPGCTTLNDSLPHLALFFF